jgi:hypothetical protein
MARKWIGIRASAGLAIAGSLATLVLGGLMLISMTLAPPPTGPAAPFPMAAIGIVMAAIFALFSGWGIWTAIGILRRRGWARVSIVIFAVLLTFTGVGGALAILVMQLPAQPNVTPGMMAAIRWGMAGFYGLLAAIGVCREGPSFQPLGRSGRGRRGPYRQGRQANCPSGASGKAGRPEDLRHIKRQDLD